MATNGTTATQLPMVVMNHAPQLKSAPVLSENTTTCLGFLLDGIIYRNRMEINITLR